MSEPPITPRQIEAFRSFVTRLPHGQDVDLVILKGHLLIEAELNEIVSARLPNAGALVDDDRFNAAFRIKLAQALFPAGHQPWLWIALGKLNTLRNRVAHKLTPPDRDKLIREVIALVPGVSSALPEPIQEQFEFTLWSLFTAVSELVEPVRGIAPKLVARE